MSTIPVSVAIPTYQHPEKLVETLAKIKACDPAPNEILVYIDNDDFETESVLRRAHSDVKILYGKEHLGPGGGRNLMLDVAMNEIVASFDDDSYPLDLDYFARVCEHFERFPKAGVLAARIIHLDEKMKDAEERFHWVADFVGCGAAYRRDAFLDTGGYVDLPIAYGMEEADLALRLIEKNWRVLASGMLRVFHDTDRRHQRNPQIVAGNLSNLALLAYLRYPEFMVWLGVIQVARKWLWFLCRGYHAGLIRGILGIPAKVWGRRGERHPVSMSVLKKYLRLRRKPEPVVEGR